MPESQIVETLIEEAMRIAEEMGEPVDEKGWQPVAWVLSSRSVEAGLRRAGHQESRPRPDHG